MNLKKIQIEQAIDGGFVVRVLETSLTQVYAIGGSTSGTTAERVYVCINQEALIKRIEKLTTKD